MRLTQQQLEANLWGAANILRGKTAGQDYRNYNWRLNMAPEFVLRYLVTHETVHLAVPDHSQKFWLTVQSLCPETERAKQWLCVNADLLTIDLRQLCQERR